MSESIELEGKLLREIADLRLTREDVALTYAMALHSPEVDVIDWPQVNKAILDRWSINALKWIKARAWKFLKERSS